jgi:antitoxin YefM
MYGITYVVIEIKSGKVPMKTLTATQARKEIYRLLDEATDTHQPIQIIGKRSNAVLISEDDWRSIQETLYLASIPGLQESIIEGIKTPLDDTEEELDW